MVSSIHSFIQQREFNSSSSGSKEPSIESAHKATQQQHKHNSQRIEEEETAQNEHKKRGDTMEKLKETTTLMLRQSVCSRRIRRGGE